MDVTVDNSNKTPAAVAPGHACAPGATAGTNVATFSVDVTVSGPHAQSVGSHTGTYGW